MRLLEAAGRKSTYAPVPGGAFYVRILLLLPSRQILLISR